MNPEKEAKADEIARQRAREHGYVCRCCCRESLLTIRERHQGLCWRCKERLSQPDQGERDAP
jgi:transcription initiation factor IIE alpha subunit